MDTLLDPGMTSTLHTAVSMALEFAWYKQVVVGGRPKKVWSQAGQGYMDIMMMILDKFGRFSNFCRGQSQSIVNTE